MLSFRLYFVTVFLIEEPSRSLFLEYLNWLNAVTLYNGPPLRNLRNFLSMVLMLLLSISGQIL